MNSVKIRNETPSLTALLLIAIGGCDDEQNLSPSLSEIDNPLDEDAFLQKILKEATEAEELTLLKDGEREGILTPMVPVSVDGFSNRIRTVDWDIFFNVAKGCRMVCIPLGMKTVKNGRATMEGWTT